MVNMASLLRYLTSMSWLIPFLCVVGLVSCNKCTNVLSRDKVQEVVVKNPCIQSYTARCGWLSLNYCTFYFQTTCDKKINETIKIYYVVTDCCKGYILDTDGTCIKMKPGMIYPSTPRKPYSSVNPDYKHEPMKQAKIKLAENKMSGGVYAGIGCGLVLVASVIVFIVIAVRKRKGKQLQNQNSGQNQMYVATSAGNAPIFRSTYVSRNPSVLISRDTSSPPSTMTVPPSSLVSTMPVEQPLLNSGINMDDIPESDI